VVFANKPMQKTIHLKPFSRMSRAYQLDTGSLGAWQNPKLGMSGSGNCWPEYWPAVNGVEACRGSRGDISGADPELKNAQVFLTDGR